MNTQQENIMIDILAAIQEQKSIYKQFTISLKAIRRVGIRLSYQGDSIEDALASLIDDNRYNAELMGNPKPDRLRHQVGLPNGIIFTSDKWTTTQLDYLLNALCENAQVA